MKQLLAIGASLAVLGAVAHADTIYTYRAVDAKQNNSAGKIKEIVVDYDEAERLSFFADLGKGQNGKLINGGWFAMSPGPNPKQSNDELAILYLDFEAAMSTPIAITGFRIRRLPGRGLGVTQATTSRRIMMVLTVTQNGDGLSVAFDDLDVSALAPGEFGADWTGVSFDENVGGWFHFSQLDAFAMKDGRISAWQPTVQSWLDVANKSATVPEPMGLALIGLGAVAGGLVWRHRRQAKATA